MPAARATSPAISSASSSTACCCACGACKEIKPSSRTTTLQLEHSHQQLRQLSGYLQTIREKEKAKLSRELHDTIGQALASIKIQTALLKKNITSSGQVDVDHVAQVIDEIGRSVEETARSVKAISTELRPGVLDKFGLAAAIEWQCEETSRRLKIDCKAHVPQEELNIPAEISTALFRILQEALTNVAVHANADAVDVDLIVDRHRRLTGDHGQR